MRVKRFVVVLLLLVGFVAVSASGILAEDAKFELKASARMRDVLFENTGKRVALRLTSGEEIEGTVAMVGNTLVHISTLAGKEYYDAVVSISKISAVRMKMRDR
ncbi:MAG: exported protein of unknown function [Candidatus Brocadiaceae bacterium]|nr:exported protein of unknown function [Candidatus Brocadiaceae bacterium]